MKLRRIQITNFRGITSLDLALGDTNVLIGENNTGKTAVLDALRFALRDVRIRRGCVFDAYDFHLATPSADPTAAPPISIQLTFQEGKHAEWPSDLLARLNRAKILQMDEHNCASVILKVGASFVALTHEFVQDWEFRNLEGVAIPGIPESTLREFHDEVSYFYLGALRDASKHFDAKGAFWRPFLKDSKLPPEIREEIETKLSEVNQLIISSHTSFEQVASKLKEVKDVVDMTGDDIVSIEAVPAHLFDMLSKAQVHLSTGTGAKVPIGRHGEGTQSLAVLTLFNAFLQTWNTGSAIVAIEEPEAHLHPSAVRAIWHLIQKIPGQKIISTHSGDILSQVPPEAITRLHKPGRVLTASRLADLDLDSNDNRKFHFHIRRDRGELLFARCWILGEGETDSTLISECARILDNELEQAGIRVVTYQTGISLETCLRVADGMGIQWVVLADNDDQGAKDHAVVRKYLGDRPEKESLFVMPEKTIEQHLCANGFADVYWDLLGDQPRSKVTVRPPDPNYHVQLAKALPSWLKTHAVQQVIAAMETTGQIPDLLKNTINAALKLAKAS